MGLEVEAWGILGHWGWKISSPGKPEHRPERKNGKKERKKEREKERAPCSAEEGKARTKQREGEKERRTTISFGSRVVHRVFLFAVCALVRQRVDAADFSGSNKCTHVLGIGLASTRPMWQRPAGASELQTAMQKQRHPTSQDAVDVQVKSFQKSGREPFLLSE